MAGGSICADLADNSQRQILCSHAFGKLAGHVNQHRLGKALR